MLRIKLSRRGKKKQPIFRILVIEKQKDPWGDFIENVGTYNPRLAENGITLKEDRVKHWLSVGAQPTPTVHNLLVDAGIISEKKVRGSNLGSAFKKKVKEDAEKAKEAAAAEADAAKEKKEAAKAEAEAPKESDSAEATPDKEAPADKKPVEEKKEEKAEEPKAEEKKEESAKEEAKEEKKAE